MDRRRRCQDRIHRARKPVGEWLLRKLQRKAARRAAERRDLLHIEGGPDHDRRLAAALQQGAATFVAGIPTAGARGTRLAGKTCGANARSKLTFQTDHSVGAGHLLQGKSLAAAAINTKRHTAEEIVTKLRQVDVLTSQGRPVAEAVRTIGVTEV